MKKPVILFIVVIIAGCARVPFQEVMPVSLETADPRSMVEHFRSGIPESFQLLNTVVFEYNWRKFPGIGLVEINTKERTFNIACMNPMGVKLFELAGDERGVMTRYAIAALTKYGDIAAAVGKDIRRIYFDLVPSPDAQIWKRKYRFIYRQTSGSGDMEHIFAGADGNLIEKRYYEDHIIVWSASYYEYREQNGKRYPQGIIFINYQYGYRLTIKQKELRF